ncbi:MAG: hypothetical protein SFU56_22445 [Capsulimonadales bacterium]|nr:hypothetical protein [Capsulimonadales bacterium]
MAQFDSGVKGPDSVRFMKISLLKLWQMVFDSETAVIGVVFRPEENLPERSVRIMAEGAGDPTGLNNGTAWFGVEVRGPFRPIYW